MAILLQRGYTAKILILEVESRLNVVCLQALPDLIFYILVKEKRRTFTIHQFRILSSFNTNALNIRKLTQLRDCDLTLELTQRQLI